MVLRCAVLLFCAVLVLYTYIVHGYLVSFSGLALSFLNSDVRIMSARMNAPALPNPVVPLAVAALLAVRIPAVASLQSNLLISWQHYCDYKATFSVCCSEGSVYPYQDNYTCTYHSL